MEVRSGSSWGGAWYAAPNTRQASWKMASSSAQARSKSPWKETMLDWGDKISR